MALPILESPKYDISLPSTGKVIQYRPFLVKEEKIMLMAQESGSSREMLSAMKDVVKACTFNKVVPNDLTSFDLEFLFLKLRTKSVGETSNIKIECSKCKEFTDVELNLDEIKSPKVNDHDNKLMLNDTVGIMMRYIRVRDLAQMTDEKSTSADTISTTIIASIQSIFDENGVYQTDESTKAELLSFVNSLNRAQVKEIEKFIATTPKVESVVKFECEHCKEKNETTLSGVQSFFG